MIKFWPSRAPGKGSAAGRKFLAAPYSAQCLRLSERFFHFCLKFTYDDDNDDEGSALNV